MLHARLASTSAMQEFVHRRRLRVSAGYRESDAAAERAFREFLTTGGGTGLLEAPVVEGSGVALIVGNVWLPLAPLEAVLARTLQIAGFSTTVLGNRREDFLRYDRLAGNRITYHFDDFEQNGDPEWVNEQANRCSSLREWTALEYRDVHVGKFVVASALRRFAGRLDFSSPDIQKYLRSALATSVRYTIAGARLLDHVRPKRILLIDRGYSGQGELFDLGISRGIDVITWHLGHKKNRIVVKRFNSGNRGEHQLAPSEATWHYLTTMPWTAERGREIRQELFSCYQSQDWFSVVGTQFGKSMSSRDETRGALALTTSRKVAVIFPHILWDGSFFSGNDLFDDYTHWFEETIRAAAANDRVQWVVRLHPAHVAKSSQMQGVETTSELDVIARVLGELPNHITLVPPDSTLSTYSLFEIADYAVTVRGTVGIEAALFGVPVLTAGTGRYDRRGFTVDSATREEYLARLAAIENIPRLTPAEIELAERYAYGVFICRPVVLENVTVEYGKGEQFTPTVQVGLASKQDWREARDIQSLAAWFRDGKIEDYLSPQVTNPTVTSPPAEQSR